MIWVEVCKERIFLRFGKTWPCTGDSFLALSGSVGAGTGCSTLVSVRGLWYPLRGNFLFVSWGVTFNPITVGNSCFHVAGAILCQILYHLHLILLKLHSIECTMTHLEKKKWSITKRNPSTLPRDTSNRWLHVSFQLLFSAMRCPPSQWPSCCHTDCPSGIGSTVTECGMGDVEAPHLAQCCGD